MAIEVTSEWTGPYAWLVYGDGRRVGRQTHVTKVTDIRDTPLGPADFGYTFFGATRTVEEHDSMEGGCG